MGLNKNDQTGAIKIAQTHGCHSSASGNSLISSNGNYLKFSSTGGSASVNGTTYNTLSGIKNSTKWK